MKNKTKLIYFLMLIQLINLPNSFGQITNQFKVFRQTIALKNNNWCILDIRNMDTNYYKIDTTTISLKLNDGYKSLDSTKFIYHDHLIQTDSFSNYYKFTIDYSNLTFKKLLDSLTFYNQWSEIILSDLGTLNSNDPFFNNQTYLWDPNHLDVENYRFLFGYGNPNITVAILDGFFDLNHPDLGSVNGGYSNIWLNNGEDAWNSQFPHGNGIDDDNNGLVDDWKGYDFYYNDNDVRPYLQNADPISIPYNFHGTVIAGIVGAKTNNSIGVAGIAGGNNTEGVKLMCLNVAQYKTLQTFAEPVIDKMALAKAILYASQKGAKIISITAAFAPNTYAPMIDEAIDIAINKYDCMIICSAGNGNGSQTSVHYPANIKDVIAIGAYDNTRNNRFGRGPELDFVAFDMLNGVNGPYLLNPTSAYGEHGGGTSLATAQIVGLSALILSKYECLPPTVLFNFFKESCQIQDFPCTAINGRCNEFGYGAPRLELLESIINDAEFNVPVIASNTEINGIKICQSDITVNSGATLTVNGTLIMSRGKKIIVNPGGKLIVQSYLGKITSNCEWGGVEVYGDQNISTGQSEAYDGIVVIRSEGSIENAKIGVKTIDEGILDANEANFRNNFISVYLSPQKSISTTFLNQVYNKSKILNSSFYINKELKSTSYNFKNYRKSYECFIKMEDLKYTFIENNYFSVYKKLDNGIGIYGYKTDVRIQDNVFTNVYSSIEIFEFPRFKLGGLSFINLINSNQFNSVSRGLTTYHLYRPQITYNIFNLASTSGKISPDGFYEYNWAISVANNAADISSNIITSNDGRAYGSIIRNYESFRKESIDKLVKNSFKDLYIGSQFEYIQKGLKPLCNQYSNMSKYAWSISPNRADKNPSFPSIGSVSNSQIGGNIFYDAYIGEYKHIRSSKSFQYVSSNSQANTVPSDRTSNVNVVTISIDPKAFCDNLNLPKNIVPCGKPECELQDWIDFLALVDDSLQREELINVIIEEYLEIQDESGLIVFLTDQNLLSAYSKELFMTALENGDLARSSYYLSIMPTVSLCDIDFKSIFEILLDLKNENKSFSQLSQYQINTLNNIKGNNTEASVYAGNIIKFALGIEFNQNPSEWKEDPEMPINLNNNIKSVTNIIRIYPNPSNYENYLIIESEKDNEILGLEIYNSIGKLIYKQAIDRKISFRIENLNFPNGLYNIKVKTKKDVNTFKFIKQN